MTEMDTPATLTNLTTSNYTEMDDFVDIPVDTKLNDVILPNEWVVYLYDKQLFKKMASRANFQAKPHREVYTLRTVNDVIYLMKLMGVKLDTKGKPNNPTSPKINLDANDIIIMRKGIEPIWEDPKNSNGGTFTVKMPHQKGYDTWVWFLSAMIGETMALNMTEINGMTISYIPDVNSYQTPNTVPICYTYLKIWDGGENRTKEQFINLISPELYEKIKTDSIMYTPNSKKKDFNEKSIIAKLSNNDRQKPRGAGSFGGFKKRY